MRQERKVKNVLNKLTKRLPDSHVFDVDTYKTIYSLLRTVKTLRGKKKTYREVVDYYTQYLTKKQKKKNKKDRYIDTKYYTPPTREFRKRRKEGLNISALAGHPIRLSLDNVKYFSDRNLAYLILHEFEHNYNGAKKYSGYWSEYKADMFAIRWMRKLIKEGLF